MIYSSVACIMFEFCLFSSIPVFNSDITTVKSDQRNVTIRDNDLTAKCNDNVIIIILAIANDNIQNGYIIAETLYDNVSYLTIIVN